MDGQREFSLTKINLLKIWDDTLVCKNNSKLCLWAQKLTLSFLSKEMGVNCGGTEERAMLRLKISRFSDHKSGVVIFMHKKKAKRKNARETKKTKTGCQVIEKTHKIPFPCKRWKHSESWSIGIIQVL